MHFTDTNNIISDPERSIIMILIALYDGENARF